MKISKLGYIALRACKSFIDTTWDQKPVSWDKSSLHHHDPNIQTYKHVSSTPEALLNIISSEISSIARYVKDAAQQY